MREPHTDAARRAVSERLRLYFAELRKQLASGVEDLWKRVESKLGRSKLGRGSADRDPTDLR